MTERDAGLDVVHGTTDTRWKRRLRGALQTLKRQGRAERVGPSIWLLRGEPTAPRVALLVSLSGAHEELELQLCRAVDLLRDLDEAADLILTDPPWALGVGQGKERDTGARTYRRDETRVVGGYVDIEPNAYRRFTSEWIAAAAPALRDGGHLVVVTGPQQAACVQMCAEDAGLEYVNSLAVGKVFALRTRRRFAHSHWRVTVMSRGPMRSPKRTFRCPSSLPKAASGADYPLDFWPIGSVGRADARPGRLRYRNSLPVLLVDRLAEAFTFPGDLLVDPFVGGGTTAVVAVARGLRFIGGDVNPRALAFTAARVSEHVASMQQVHPHLAVAT